MNAHIHNRLWLRYSQRATPCTKSSSQPAALIYTDISTRGIYISLGVLETATTAGITHRLREDGFGDQWFIWLRRWCAFICRDKTCTTVLACDGGWICARYSVISCECFLLPHCRVKGVLHIAHCETETWPLPSMVTNYSVNMVEKATLIFSNNYIWEIGRKRAQDVTQKTSRERFQFGFLHRFLKFKVMP